MTHKTREQIEYRLDWLDAEIEMLRDEQRDLRDELESRDAGHDTQQIDLFEKGN